MEIARVSDKKAWIPQQLCNNKLQMGEMTYVYQ